MRLKMKSTHIVLLLLTAHSVRPDSSPNEQNVQANDDVSFSKMSNTGISSIFSPRMDFDRWKPLTGRGDPLRNDPTYDYEPPVLERVHYWADDTRLEREKQQPERKSEVLVLGVSSRKPSIVSRPPMPYRRSPRPPVNLPKYEDYSYKLSNEYPMTILVPPPPLPPGHKPVLFIIPNENRPPITTPTYIESTTTKEITPNIELITSYALQEANLIYQSSTKHDWYENGKINSFPNVSVSSDYAGWGPTTPLDDNFNESHNIIPYNDNNIQIPEQKHTYQKPENTVAPLLTMITPKIKPTFLPTIIPPTTNNVPEDTWSYTESTLEITTEIYNKKTPTHFENNDQIPRKTTQTTAANKNPSMVDMLAPMMSMPMVTDSDSENDKYFAHASENINIFKEPVIRDDLEIEVMQTMQPPPPVETLEGSTYSPYQDFHEKIQSNTHDPYLHMRYTTPVPSTESSLDNTIMTEKHVPTYLIIQGHSKVKTYGSKPKSSQNSASNDIINPNETNEVKHLHPIKEKKKNNDPKGREGRSNNLKSLIDKGFGSIEIQETDVGIKYDISDGSNVPLEIYKKGIVDNDENSYVSKRKNITDKRVKRQIDLESLLPFDEDTLEEFVYDFFDSRQNNTGIVGMLAKTITNKKVSSLVDSLEEDDDDVDKNNNDR